MSRALLLAAPLALLAGCAGSAGPCPLPGEPALPPAADACGAAELARYVGAAPTADVMAAIARVTGQRTIRTIRPGDAVTMDFREDRLNVELDNDGRIARLRCS